MLYILMLNSLVIPLSDSPVSFSYTNSLSCLSEKWHLSSPPTLRILASLYEHDLDFEFVPIEINAGEHKKPFGQVPAFRDGNLTLFESTTVMRYIAFGYPKQGQEHIFKDPLIKGIAAVWIDAEDRQFDPPASKLIDELIFKPGTSLVSDRTTVPEEAAKLAKVLDVYEQRLADHPSSSSLLPDANFSEAAD